MEKEDLIAYKKKTAELTEEEFKQRDLYLKGLADGTLQGSPIGIPSIDKPWLKFFDNDFLLKNINNISIYSNLINNNKDNLDSVAISYFGKNYTYRDLIMKIDIVANSFLNLGIKNGDIVTLSLPNTPENVFCLYALNKIGAICNFIDLRLKGEKLIDAIESTESTTIVTTDLFVNNLDEIVSSTHLKNVIIGSPFDSLPPALKALASLKKPKSKLKNFDAMYWKEFEKKGLKTISYEYEPCLESPVCILHTSGTTGNPKGVILTNKNFLEMSLQVSDGGLVYNKGDVFLSQVPPFLAYNVLAATNNPLSMGLKITMLPDYNPEKFADNILKYKPNHVIAGPADWSSFLKSEILKGKDLSFLSSMISGSDKIDEEIKKKINNILHEHGCKGEILEGYGMTEIGAAAVMNIPQHNVADSVGIPLRNVNICIWDNENDRELSYGAEGEICLSGPTVMKEYLNMPEETSLLKKVHADGSVWIHTGDLGYLNEDGNLFLKGRIKRVIIRFDGIKISPFDIEKIISKHENVLNCCVVGIDNEEMGYGSVPIANIVLKNNELEEKTKMELFEMCKQELGEKYQPQDFVVLDSMPLTDVGKVNYRKVQELDEELRRIKRR